MFIVFFYFFCISAVSVVISPLSFLFCLFGSSLQDWSAPTVRGATEYSSTGAAHQEVCSVVLPVIRCVGSQSMLFWTLPSAPPQLWNAGLGVPQALCSQSHQRRFVVTDPLKSRIRTTVVTHLDMPWELWKQPRPLPCLHVCAFTKPTSSNSGSAPDTGAHVIYLDDPQALSL